MKSTPTTRPRFGLLIAGALAAAAFWVPAPALAQPVPGATYTGTINGGGTVDFDVSADGQVITRFKGI
jgi:hypothetical protein